MWAIQIIVFITATTKTGGDDVNHPVTCHSSTLVPLLRMQLNKRYFLLRVDRMTMDGIVLYFLSLRQCPLSHIYMVVPIDPFDPMTVTNINYGIYLYPFSVHVVILNFYYQLMHLLI